MKYVMAAAVVAVLIVAPLGSYFYLKNGFSYRIEALEELTPKETSSRVQLVLDSLSENRGKVQLIHFPSFHESEELALLHQLDKRIVDKNSFEIISFSDDTDTNSEIVFPSHENMAELMGRDSTAFVLVDTSGVVRQYYSFNENTAKALIKHLAIIIPMPKRKDIKLKRDVTES